MALPFVRRRSLLHRGCPASRAGRRDPGSGSLGVRARWGVIGLSLCAAAAVSGHAAGADGSIAGLTQALAVAESRAGVASPHLLPLLDRLAGAQVDDGALAEATASRRRALKIALTAFGSSSRKAAEAMTALAEIDILQHQYLDAEPLLTAASRILSGRREADGPALATGWAGLARIALARGDTKLAEAWAVRADAIPTRNPARSTEPLRVLGAAYAAEQRFDDGERILRLALARDRHSHGDASPEAARSLAQLANLLLRAQQFDEALPMIEQAIAIDQSRLGPTHPLIADDFCDLGLIYAGLKRDEDARRVLSFAIDLLDEGAGGNDTRIAYAEIELATVLRRLGDKDAADAAADDAKHILDDAEHEERARERQI
jgi:tetratricopeptide (TPR) repeat protein